LRHEGRWVTLLVRKIFIFSTIAIAVFLKTGYAVNQNLDPVTLKTHYGIQLKTINNNPSPNRLWFPANFNLIIR
jgi:hypothetical protein